MKESKTIKPPPGVTLLTVELGHDNGRQLMAYSGENMWHDFLPENITKLTIKSESPITVEWGS